jgi:hypothetical protein
LDYQIPEFNTNNTTEIKAMSLIFSKCHRRSCWNAGSRNPPLTPHPNNILENDTYLVAVVK